MLNYGYHKEEHVGERTQKKKLEMTSIEIQGRRAVISGKTRSLCMGWREENNWKDKGPTGPELAVLSFLYHQWREEVSLPEKGRPLTELPLPNVRWQLLLSVDCWEMRSNAYLEVRKRDV